MKQKLIPVLLLIVILPPLATTSQAQVTFSVGTRVGLNLANVPFKDQDRTYRTNTRTGLEAGLVAHVGFGHFAVQPAVLFQ